MFKLRLVLIPYATRNVMYHSGVLADIGYTEHYIFGIRIARVQKTVPW